MKQGTKGVVTQKKKMPIGLYLRNTWQLYLMLLLPIAYIVCFKYKPMAGIVIAFQKYNPFVPEKSTWVGFDNFQKAFGNSAFWNSLWSTLILNLGDLIIGFPIPVFLAIFLNELRSSKVRKVTQTLLYLPNFLSWVIISGIFTQIFAGSGLINNIITGVGGSAIPFLSNSFVWRFVYWFSGVWQSSGYSLIIFLAALMSTDPSLGEAAYIDGATRLQRIWHVTVPQIMPTISTLLIMQLGKIVNISLDRPLMMGNTLVSDASDVISVYVYESAMQAQRFDYAAAIGLFQSVVGIILILSVNQVSKKMGQEGIM